MLSGAITAIVTPMNDNGDIDFQSLNNLVEFQINNGISGLVVLGSTGEAFTLLTNEKLKLLQYVIGKSGGRVKIIAGVSSASTAEAVDFINKLNKVVGIDYIMAITPYYMKPTQEGMYQHFSQISKVSKYPVLLYNVPGRTSSDLQNDTILRLAHDFKNIVGIKDATGNVERLSYLLKYKPQDFMLLSGDDATSLAYMMCGGDGVISVVSNLVPAQMSKMCKHAISGEKALAIAANNEILELHSAMFIEANPIPLKWALYHSQIIVSPYVRLPLTVLSDAFQVKIKSTIEQVTKR
ncbi:MAG: 4-hydroxy-tetrahydrodipicolinate synthase [Proteobacteria bacterium]|jgi:4-hydroxy-tetrahydrodipicolinate synthase|nr:4-hydroxy-tetrahydrodipicolinate synthase [Pseudomonadota bacterium]